MNFDPKDLDESSAYKLLVGCVMPRPIAWISTIALDGKVNLAPFSFFNVASRYPPTLAISISYPVGKEKEKKDTLKNIEDTKELVVNVVPLELVEQMNITASELPLNINEFEVAHLDMAHSTKVNPPRIAEAKVSMECVCKEVIPIGVDHLIIAEVVQFIIADEVIVDGKIQIDNLNLVGRMAGPVYCTTDNTFKLMVLPPSSFI